MSNAGIRVRGRARTRTIDDRIVFYLIRISSFARYVFRYVICAALYKPNGILK